MAATLMPATPTAMPDDSEMPRKELNQFMFNLVKKLKVLYLFEDNVGIEQCQKVIEKYDLEEFPDKLKCFAPIFIRFNGDDIIWCSYVDLIEKKEYRDIMLLGVNKFFETHITPWLFKSNTLKLENERYSIICFDTLNKRIRSMMEIGMSEAEAYDFIKTMGFKTKALDKEIIEKKKEEPKPKEKVEPKKEPKPKKEDEEDEEYDEAEVEIITTKDGKTKLGYDAKTNIVYKVDPNGEAEEIGKLIEVDTDKAPILYNGKQYIVSPKKYVRHIHICALTKKKYISSPESLYKFKRLCNIIVDYNIKISP